MLQPGNRRAAWRRTRRVLHARIRLQCQALQRLAAPDAEATLSGATPRSFAFMSPGNDPSHYEILSAPADASPDALRRAYRRAAQRHHPDRTAGDSAAQRRMARINEAYSVLSHPERRASYDQWMRACAARRAADVAVTAARPSRFAAAWPWGLVAVTTAFTLFTVGTAVYKSTAPAIAAPVQASGH